MRIPSLFMAALAVSLAAFACSSTNDDAVTTGDAGADGASQDAASDGGSISGGSYAQACTAETDCTLIHEGDVCQPCLNQNAAINVSDRAKYDADFSTLRNSCGPMPAIACVAIVQRKPICQASKCASVPIEEDAGSDASSQSEDASTADADAN